jgi:hypothetical protein
VRLADQDLQYEGAQETLIKLKFTPNLNFYPSEHAAKVFHDLEGILLVDNRQKRLAEIRGQLISEGAVPKPPKDSFDENAAARGKELFEGQAKCATCHVLPLFTEPGWNMHTPEEIGVDDFQANRAPDKRYRTAPLKGLWTHTKGGFYHDGRFATLNDVVQHYNSFLGLGLSDSQVRDLVA